MARDICIDCEGDFPFGEGLKDGLCKTCRAARGALHAEARKAAKLAAAVGPAPKREPEPEDEPEPEPEPEPEEEE